jgi:hypothetical protein
VGWYEVAAYAALQAGIERERMGRMMIEAGEVVFAAEDWLSAAACFLLATAPARSSALLDEVRRLDAEGKVPTDRRDMHAALREHGQGLETLIERIARFRRELDERHTEVPDPQTLDYLLKQVRDLPGLADLHAAIHQQAAALGRQELADKHLAWAKAFDPAANAATGNGLAGNGPDLDGLLTQRSPGAPR